MNHQPEVLVDHVIPASKDGAGAAFEMSKGQHIKVIGRSTVDFVVFNRNNLKERFDQARTKTNQLKIFLTKGDVLISKDNNAMMTLVDDTWPWKHDLQKGMCSRKRHELVFRGEAKVEVWGQEGHQRRWERWEDIPQRGCWENLAQSLKPWAIDPWDIPSPFNIFQNMRIDGDTGRMWFDHRHPDEDFYVEMRAEMDLVIAGSHHFGVTTRIQIYEP